MSSPPRHLFLSFFPAPFLYGGPSQDLDLGHGHFSFLTVSLFGLRRDARFFAPAHLVNCRRAQGQSRLARLFGGHPQGLAFTELSTTAGLMGRVDYTPVCYLSILASARVIAGLATKSMARAMFASTYIRQLRSGLPRCCLHGRSRRRDGAHLWNGRSASADLRCWPTATHPTRPTHPRLGCRNSAQCRRYRVRVAPCGTRPCSR